MNMNNIKTRTNKKLIAKRNSVKFIDRPDLNFEVMDHIGLVHIIVKSICNRTGNFSVYSDLIQEGCFGLMYAYAKYDPSLNYKFTTYARKWIISQTYKHALRDSLIRIKLNYFKEDIRKEILSLDFYDSREKDDVNNCQSTKAEEYFERASMSELNVVKQTFFEILKQTLKERIQKILKPKEQLLIEHRYYKDQSLAESAVNSGINSKQRAQQIEKDVIKKLKEDKDIQNLYPLYQELLYSF